MERNTALGAAAGVVLAVVGAVSALFLTIDRPAEAASTDAPAVEYVDQYGNPATAPIANAAPEIVLINPDGTLVEPAAPEAATAYGGEYGEQTEEAEYEDEAEYGEEDEYEDEDEDEYEDEEEYEDHDEDNEEADDEYEEDEDDD